MQTEKVVFCIQCGTKLPAEAKFCFRCGSTLPASDAQDGDSAVSENTEAAIEQEQGQEYDAAVTAADEQPQEAQEAEKAETSEPAAPPCLNWTSIVLTPEEEEGLTSRQRRELKRRKARELQKQQAEAEAIAADAAAATSIAEDQAADDAYIENDEGTDEATLEAKESEPLYEYEDEDAAVLESGDEYDVQYEPEYGPEEDTATVSDESPEVIRARKVLEQFGVQSSSMHGQFFFAPVIVSNNATLMELIQRCTIIPQTPQDEKLISAIKTMPPYKAQQIELMEGWNNPFNSQLLMGGFPLQQEASKPENGQPMTQTTPPEQATDKQPDAHTGAQQGNSFAATADIPPVSQATKAASAPTPPPPPPPKPAAPVQKPATQAAPAQQPASPPPSRPAPAKPAQQQSQQTRPQQTHAQAPRQQQAPQAAKAASAPASPPPPAPPAAPQRKPAPNRPQPTKPNPAQENAKDRKFQGRAKKEKAKPVEAEEEEYDYYDGMAEDDGRERKEGAKDDKKTTIIKMAAVLVGTGIIMWLMLSVLPNIL